MTFLMVGILAFLALVVGGIFLPVLWVPAVAILVLGVIYGLRSARAVSDSESV
jgi:hypothetical protein